MSDPAPAAYSYCVYGLGIRSEICLSELDETSAPADIRVRRGKVEPPQSSDGRSQIATEHDIYFRLNGAGACHISRGEEIVIDAGHLDDHAAGQFVIGPAMGAVMHQRGLLVLHASAVLAESGVLAFLGNCGDGKSTMAGAMLNQGCRAFSDDLAPVNLEGGEPTVLPGFACLKLAPESGKALGRLENDWKPILPEDRRSYVAVDGAPSRAAVRLLRIYVLGEGTAPAIECLAPQDAAHELIRFSYGCSWLQERSIAAHHLKSCAKLVGQVPVRRLVRPRRLDLLDDVAKLVMRDARQDHGAAS